MLAILEVPATPLCPGTVSYNDAFELFGLISDIFQGNSSMSSRCHRSCQSQYSIPLQEITNSLRADNNAKLQSFACHTAMMIN